MPKRTPLDLMVPGTPDEVARALKEDTFFRPFPTGGSGPIRLSKKPLGGRVNTRGFNVSLYEPTWVNLTRPVARAKLTATPGGTRIEGEVGLHAWVTNYLRVTTVALVLGAIAAGVQVVAAGALAGGIVAVLAFLLITTLSIGANVAHADDNVERLKAQVETSLRGATKTLARTLGEPDPEALRAAEAELDALETRPLDRTPEGPAGT